MLQMIRSFTNALHSGLLIPRRAEPPASLPVASRWALGSHGLANCRPLERQRIVFADKLDALNRMYKAMCFVYKGNLLVLHLRAKS